MRTRPDPALSVTCDECGAEVGAGCVRMRAVGPTRRRVPTDEAALAPHRTRTRSALAPLRQVRALRDARDEVEAWLAVECAT